MFTSDHVLPKGEINTGKKNNNHSWHRCNAQYVCMSKLMHFDKALNMFDGLLGFAWQLCNFSGINPEMDLGGHSGQFWKYFKFYLLKWVWKHHKWVAFVILSNLTYNLYFLNSFYWIILYFLCFNWI